MEASSTIAIKPFSLLFILWFAYLFTHTFGEYHYHEFVVQESPVKRLCNTHNRIFVNGQFPGPTLEVTDGDTLEVKVTNKAIYNITIHWHGVRQFRTAWADGPEFVTQCPIRPGESYTYRFTVLGQIGTLWWHAHSSWLRATVYGALIIHPRGDYPFKKPDQEIPIILGDWWNRNPIDVVKNSTRFGVAPDISDAFTINGQPGDLYKCSTKGTKIFPVKAGETNLLRFINAALNTELFIAIAGHKMTVVGADASYDRPFDTSVLMLSPGQTTDVLVTFDQAPHSYYLAARAYSSAQGFPFPFDNTTTTAIIDYGRKTKKPGKHSKIEFPTLPDYNDTATATKFAESFRGLEAVKLPQPVNENLFFTVGVGLLNCTRSKRCGGPNGTRFTASINNVSFVLPSNFSILQAYYHGIPGVFTTEFPAVPPVQFNYTAQNVSHNLWQPVLGTKLYKLKYGSVVQLVLQGTNIFAAESHPIHLHGNDFYILAQGFGNFNSKKDTSKFNLVDPPLRNTVSVPVNGWAVIRFVADNPGVWLMHCHLDVHINWGLAMAFLVEDGTGELESLEPPPNDLPLC